MSRVLIVPDSFKGSLTAQKVADTIENTLITCLPGISCKTIPLADGGEGTTAAAFPFLKGTMIQSTVSGPIYGQNVDATWFLPHKPNEPALIEMAAASGLPLLPKNLQNPLKTTTYGTGELIKIAFEKGCRNIILGLGGSATCDGGVGAAAAMGFKFINSDGEKFIPLGESLSLIQRIDEDSANPLIQAINDGSLTITAACDVKNRVHGRRGAAAVFAPQKGADKQGMRILQKGLKNLTRISGYNSIAEEQGTGAAGGFGFAVSAFFKGDLLPGFQLLSQLAQLDDAIQKASVIITGEGALDKQSLMGKLIGEILKKISHSDKKLIIICGHSTLPHQTIKRVSKRYQIQRPSIYSLTDTASSKKESIQQAEKYLKLSVVKVAEDFNYILCKNER